MLAYGTLAQCVPGITLLPGDANVGGVLKLFVALFYVGLSDGVKKSFSFFFFYSCAAYLGNDM